MKVETMEKLTELMLKLTPVLEEAGFLVADIGDNSNSSWEKLAINILPKPKEGSIQAKILAGEGF